MSRFLCLALLLSGSAVAQEPHVTLHSTVSGSREQPRVMYILPWQQAKNGDFTAISAGDRPGDLFAPLDRDDFRRELRYQRMLGDTAAAGLLHDGETN